MNGEWCEDTGGEQVRMKVVQAVGGTRKGAVDEKKMTSGVP